MYRVLAKEHGQSAVEYGLILVLVALVGLSGFAVFATEVGSLWATVLSRVAVAI